MTTALTCKETKLTLINHFNTQFPDGILQMISEQYTKELKAHNREKQPASILAYIGTTLDCLRDWIEHCSGFLLIHQALDRNISRTARKRSVNAINHHGHIANDPSLKTEARDKSTLICYSAVR